MKYDVEVFVGEDSVRSYLVEAADEATAANIACERARDLVGASIGPADDDASEDDYDEVLS